MQTHLSRRRLAEKGVEVTREPIALAADWLQVCERITQVVARQRLLIAERLAAPDDRRAALPARERS